MNRVVVIQDNGRFVSYVDPRTGQATGEPQQFRAVPDERGFGLVILPKAEWIDDPVVFNVDSVSGFSGRPNMTLTQRTAELPRTPDY